MAAVLLRREPLRSPFEAAFSAGQSSNLNAYQVRLLKAMGDAEKKFWELTQNKQPVDTFMLLLRASVENGLPQKALYDCIYRDEVCNSLPEELMQKADLLLKRLPKPALMPHIAAKIKRRRRSDAVKIDMEAFGAAIRDLESMHLKARGGFSDAAREAALRHSLNPSTFYNYLRACADGRQPGTIPLEVAARAKKIVNEWP